MKNSEHLKANESNFPRLFAGLWLLITFLNVPYFLVALDLEPSQFLLLENLLVNIHPGIHHGLIGYIALSFGMLGLYYSQKIKEPDIRNYLFLISLFFLIKGTYLSFEDLMMEQIMHSTVEQTYIWHWKAPQVEIFSLIALIPGLWMENKVKLFSWLVPVIVVSIFVTPFGPITIGYLILLLVFDNENSQAPGEVKRRSRVFKWTSGIVGICLAFVYAVILAGEIIINVF